MKKFFKNNKGFTLVELIIVIAVMAVLTVVVAPQYVKYVENSRIATDENALDEIKHVAEIEYVELSAEERLADADLTFNVTIVNGTATISNTKLGNAVAEVVSGYEFKSDDYYNKTIVVTVDRTSGLAEWGPYTA